MGVQHTKIRVLVVVLIQSTNYMDYSNDSCMSRWTGGQIARMISQCETYRAIYPTYPNPEGNDLVDGDEGDDVQDS